jgi:hypothetical protein
MTKEKTPVSGGNGVDPLVNPLLGVRSLQRELEADDWHLTNIQGYIGMMTHASTEARELLLRKVMLKLVFAIEVMTHGKNFSQEAINELVEALSLAGIFAQCTFRRAPGGKQAYTVDAAELERWDVAAKIIAVHQAPINQ